MVIVADMQSHISQSLFSRYCTKVQYLHKKELRQEPKRAGNGNHKGSTLHRKVLYYGVLKDVLMSYWINLPKVVKHYLMRKALIV